MGPRSKEPVGSDNEVLIGTFLDHHRVKSTQAFNEPAAIALVLRMCVNNTVLDPFRYSDCRL